MTWITSHILSFLILFPAVGALFIAMVPKDKKKAVFGLAAFISLLEFVFSLHLYFHFNEQSLQSYEFFESVPWITAWNVFYTVGIDGVSLLLILLSTLLTPLVIIGSVTSVTEKFKGFVISLLLLEAGMIGVFCALDLFLFYVFWEVMLIPMYFIIGIWGGKNRIYASVKFVIYTMVGSLLMLVGILYLYHKGGGTFMLEDLTQVPLLFKEQSWLFLAFGLAFAIKVPLFPFHTWLPDAHVEAPTAGSVILAGVLLKMGTYGFFRFAMPLFPEALVYFQPWLIGLSVFGIVYGALVALVQTDIKKLIAYSSVSHLGVVMLGLFALDPSGMKGGLYQMLNHGISTGALFLLIGILYERTHSREIAKYGGLASLMPIFSVVFLIVTFSSIGLPLTNGFIGEFLSLSGAFQTQPLAAVVATSGVVLSAGYMLWLVERVFYGEAKSPVGLSLPDLNFRELAILIPLLAFIVWMGVYPKPFLQKLDRPVAALLEQMTSKPVEENMEVSIKP